MRRERDGERAGWGESGMGRERDGERAGWGESEMGRERDEERAEKQRRRSTKACDVMVAWWHQSSWATTPWATPGGCYGAACCVIEREGEGVCGQQGERGKLPLRIVIISAIH